MTNIKERYFNKKDNELYIDIKNKLSDVLNESMGVDISGSQHLETVETCLAQIKKEHDVHMNLMKIRKAINAEFKTNCTSVFITDNKVKSYFFGAHIIPTEKECYKLADNIARVNKNIKFEQCSEFVIELDSKLIYTLDATPEEITAVILHEIGHKVFYSKNKVQMKEKLIATLLANGALSSVAIITQMLAYRFILFTLILNFFASTFSNALSIKEEIDSDSFAVRYGYGAALNSVIQQIMDNSRSFNTFGFARSKDKEDEALTKWCFNSIIGFKFRQKAIRKDLEFMLKSEQNPEVRKIINAQISMVDNMVKRNKGLKGLSVMNDERIRLGESFSAFAEMSSKGISYLELDELEVEIERIRDPEDKLYVVSRIHKDLADNGKFIKEKEKQLHKKRLSDEQIKDHVEMKELMTYRTQLMDLLAKCRKASVREKHHHFIVGYPLGYEG